MPELPETETIARDLDALVRGSRIVSVDVTHSDVLRGVSKAALARRVAGASIGRVWRRAKLVVIDLDSEDRLVVQPRFTGALMVDSSTAPLSDRDRSYSALSFRLDDDRALHYRDIRRLGTVALLAPAAFERAVAPLGMEPLDPAFTGAHLSAVLARSRQAVKKVLMDQRAIAGIGNIYATESLWRAGIDPSREARLVARDGEAVDRLRAEITSVLTESIAARGTSFRDYRDAFGRRGGFVDHLAAYGRAGEPCLRCGRRLVGTHAIDGRMTVLCVHCQS